MVPFGGGCVRDAKTELIALAEITSADVDSWCGKTGGEARAAGVVATRLRNVERGRPALERVCDALTTDAVHVPRELCRIVAGYAAHVAAVWTGDTFADIFRFGPSVMAWLDGQGRPYRMGDFWGDRKELGELLGGARRQLGRRVLSRLFHCPGAMRVLV